VRVGAGTGDPGYTGEYLIGLINHGQDDYIIRKGDRIAQIQVVERIAGDFVDAEMEDTSRGAGGFGSTGR
jgi:dUTP pyrophosphatase